MVSPPGHRIAGGLGLSLGWGECIGRNIFRIKVERFGGGGGGDLVKLGRTCHI